MTATGRRVKNGYDAVTAQNRRRAAWPGTFIVRLSHAVGADLDEAGDVRCVAQAKAGDRS